MICKLRIAFLSAQIIFFFSTFCHGQTFTLSPSPIDDNSFDNIKVIGQDDGGVFLLQSNLPLELERDRVGFRNRKYKVAYYSNELVPRWTKAVEPMPENASIQAITFSHQKILITSGIENKAQGKLTLYGEWMNNKGELSSNKEIGTVSFQNNSDYEKAKLVASANQQLIGLMVHEYIDDSKQAVHLLITDTALNLQNSKNLMINYGNKNFTATDYSLSNKRDFHLLGVRSIKDKSAGKKRVEDFLLFSAPDSSQLFSEFLVSEGGKDITGASISFDNLNNKIVCAGFYADRNSNTGAGVIYAMIDMNNPSQLIVKTHSIDSGTQLKLLGDRNSGYDIGLISYPIQKIIHRNDGGAVIVAEASYTNDYSYYDYFTQSFTRRTEYHYNNIVVISINNDATIHWLNIIRKDQESEDDGGIFSSFCLMLTADEMVLIYNSDISRNSEVTGQIISNSGVQTEKHLVRPTEHVLLFSRNGKQVSENEVIIPCISKKKIMLGKFTF